MGKKSAHSGMSPKDRAINMMDKFIIRNANRTKNQPILPERRKDVDIPLNLWPVHDQLDYWMSRTDNDRFDEAYASYSTWYEIVKKQSGVYPSTFLDFTSHLKPLMRELWEKKITPKNAILELRKHGVY